MKKFLLILLSGAVAPAVFAQGSFNALNYTADQGVVMADYGTGPVRAGSEFSVQVYWGLLGTPEQNLVPVGSPSALFGVTGSDGSDGSGFFDLGTVLTHPEATVGPANILVQIRGWGGGSSWETATFRGQSAIVQQPIAFSTSFPVDLVPTGQWVIPVPEPSSFALLGLGLGALAMFRRRK